MFSLTTLYAEMFKIVALFYDFYFFFLHFPLDKGRIFGGKCGSLSFSQLKSLKLFDYFKHSAEK